jgi:hypothetical protein
MLHWLLHLLDHGNALCDDWCLHFWEVVGVWFTGIATFAAVFVSLALARHEGVNIKVSAGQFVKPGPVSPFPEILNIRVRNVGTRTAIIEGIAWRRRPWGKLHALQMFAPAQGYFGPPVTIEGGNSHSFTLPLSHTEIRWGEWFLKDFVGRWPRFGVHFICVIAYTPAGVRCSAFIDSSLKQWLIAKADAMRSPSPPT